ncbi:unnamed protein product [Vitrella brassicaformis CCMP3155]|uniref:AB hydrolase-1 domain-containing protein n=2 Tax=Vitrella brassicaformis TaxID=1169539 RepID=A0A0G4EZ74_VITBC|nr:unnamed protein product [Vitrella brassicaformis CCMP3155]|eukprot:CEM04495.1 unnamed protein product [Vitrella brassicaformis CCMP3155]
MIGEAVLFSVISALLGAAGGHAVLQRMPRDLRHTAFVPQIRPARQTVSRRRTLMSAGVPDIPPEASQIQEQAAKDLLEDIRGVTLTVPPSICPQQTLQATYVQLHGDDDDKQERRDPPVVLLHGFDSSVLEFRRFVPFLREAGVRGWIVDIHGWGFGQLDGGCDFSAESKRLMLYEFWRQVVGERAVFVGSSLGGSIALDVAAEHPECVDKLLLIAPQATMEGLGPLSSLPDIIGRLGIRVLGSVPLRQFANQLAYYDKERLATTDAMRVGRLHTLRRGWEDASLSFQKSGGFAVKAKLSRVNCDVQLVWGANDQILPPESAHDVLEALQPHTRSARLAFIDQCGHLPHLEKPHVLIDHFRDFLRPRQINGDRRRGARQDKDQVKTTSVEGSRVVG